MNEISIHGRVSVQPTSVLAHLGRVAWDLPNVPPHPLERSSLHVPWTYAFALELMHRVCHAGPRHLRHWTDFTTSVQSSFLAYDHQYDTFTARPAVVASSTRQTGGEVGSASRLARRKRYQDLDGELPTFPFAGTNPPSGLSVPVGHPPIGEPPGSPVPPLNSTPTRAVPSGEAIRRLTLERADIHDIPILHRALGDASDRPWQVERLLSTPPIWYFARGDEGRRISAQCDWHMSELCHMRSELTRVRKAVATRTGV